MDHERISEKCRVLCCIRVFLLSLEKLMMMKIGRRTSGTIAALGSGEGSPGAFEAAGPVILEVSGKYGSGKYDSPPVPSENKEI